jgi:antitoxin YefM
MLVTTQRSYGDADALFQRAVDDCEPVIVPHENDNSIVILPLCEYENLLENLHIRQSKNNYNRLQESIEQTKQGKLIPFDLEGHGWDI